MPIHDHAPMRGDLENAHVTLARLPVKKTFVEHMQLHGAPNKHNSKQCQEQRHHAGAP